MYLPALKRDPCNGGCDVFSNHFVDQESFIEFIIKPYEDKKKVFYRRMTPWADNTLDIQIIISDRVYMKKNIKKKNGLLEFGTKPLAQYLKIYVELCPKKQSPIVMENIIADFDYQGKKDYFYWFSMVEIREPLKDIEFEFLDGVTR